MDELRTEMLAGEEGARRDLATERDERVTSGTEAMVAAAELQAWAEGAVARQAAEIEAAVLGGVASGLVATAATDGLAAEVAAQRQALESAFAEEKRKSWEQVSPTPSPHNPKPNPDPDPNPSPDPDPNP